MSMNPETFARVTIQMGFAVLGARGPEKRRETAVSRDSRARAAGASAILLVLLVLAPGAWAAPQLPVPPTTYDASLPDTTGYNVYGPLSAQDLQNHLDSIGSTNSGHSSSDLTNGVILGVTAGTSTDTIDLPNHALAAGKWVIIRPHDAAYAALPASGTRAGVSDAANMWQIAAPDLGRGITTENNAHNYRLIGLELKPAGADPFNFVNSLAAIGFDANGVSIATASQSPENIVFDRCYVHGNAGTQNVRNGIVLYSKTSAVVDSLIDNIWLLGAESHGVFMSDTVGPILIQNNQISNATTGVFTGGVAAAFDAAAPHDVTIRRNYFYKDTAYRGQRFIKNHLEFKRMTRALIEQNLFSQIWSEDGDQDGSVMQLTIRTEGLDATARLDDITIRWNWIKGAATGINAGGIDGSAHLSEGAARLHVHDNLWDDMNRTLWDPIGAATARGFIGVFNGYDDLTVDHNSVILQGAQTGQAYMADGLAASMPAFTMGGFTFTNNLTLDRDYGWWSDGGETDLTAALSTYFGGSPAWAVTNNIIAQSGDSPNSNFPVGNITSVTEAVFEGGGYFTDYANRNYKLRSGVAGQGAGKVFGTGAADGDIGISNYDTFTSKVAGVQAGLPEGPFIAVGLAGVGTGTVSSNVGGISCPGICGASYTSGTVVTLTAAATAPSSFVGWSGGGCSGTGPCVVTVTGATSITATFTAPTSTLSVVKMGSGGAAGTVTSNPAGIICGATCSADFATGTGVTLTVNPGPGNTFTGWGGACSGAATTCNVTLTSTKSVTASFQGPVLTVTAAAGGGGGSVTSSPAGISCPGTCSQDYAPNQSVTLTAAAAPGSTFAGWIGAGCSGVGATPCTVTLTASRTVTPIFVLQTFTLAVTPSGGGTGTVTSTPAGIDCGATCSASYPYGTMVTLTANAASGSVFTGWLGAGCVGIGPCVIVVTAATTVTTSFTLQGAAVTFTDPMLGAGTMIKVVHITELRQAINQLRTSKFSMAPFSFVDAVLTPGVSMVKAAHLTDLRTALNQIYAPAGRTPPAYTDPALAPDSVQIRAIHITELRAAVGSLE
jgi:hypothetical protein